MLKKNGIEYDARKKVIYCNGPRDVDFELDYEGASDLAGPNYTGQNAVDSFYKIIIASL
ncbi:hypothetical protein [Pseudoflavitalea sp. G-6-1-2]|uniref:hypothetical protein n=1 Tax=Pseudoflavitalea sp. G-6-1-2 TaxID=2728841 RepID=UPI001F0F848D|nr:hypothetical protein [Pseudoflavitalea sp. G-6-1-2]